MNRSNTLLIMPALIFVSQWDKLLQTTVTIEFSRNIQSWQCWHFCTTSNGNKLEVVTSGINVNANIYICHEALN